MRTLLFTTAAALVLSITVQAQEKSVPTTAITQPTQANSAFAEQRREISGLLKNTLGSSDALLKKAVSAATNGKEEDQQKHQKIASGIKELQAKVNEQLVLVNRVPESEGETAFVHAREVNSISRSALEAYANELGVEPVKDKPASK